MKNKIKCFGNTCKDRFKCDLYTFESEYDFENNKSENNSETKCDYFREKKMMKTLTEDGLITVSPIDTFQMYGQYFFTYYDKESGYISVIDSYSGHSILDVDTSESFPSSVGNISKYSVEEAKNILTKYRHSFFELRHKLLLDATGSLNPINK